MGRYLIRSKLTRNFQLSDALHGLALIALLVLVTVSTVAYAKIYSLRNSLQYHGTHPKAKSYSESFKYATGISVVALVCVSSVRFSMLIFYRTIFGISHTFMRLWWFIAACALLVLVPTIAGLLMLAIKKDIVSLFVGYLHSCVWVQCTLDVPADILGAFHRRLTWSIILMQVSDGSAAIHA